MLLNLPEVIIDMIKLRFTTWRMPLETVKPVFVVRIPVRLQKPFRVWDAHVEYAALAEYAERLSEKMWDLFRKFEVLEGMFAVDMRNAVIVKWPMFPQVQLQIGCSVKEVYVKPPPPTVGTTTEVKSERSNS